MQSVVAFTREGGVVVGADAATAPVPAANRVMCIKRLMGESHEDMQRFSVRGRLFTTIRDAELMLKKTGASPRLSMTIQLDSGPGQVDPVLVSAHVINKAVTNARERLGVPQGVPTKVVITVPAYFRQAQREDTRCAGEVAGIQVLDMVEEPAAAALACLDVMRKAGDPRARGQVSLAVVDIGGGTFDVSVLTEQDRLLRVMEVDGHKYLGGEKFTMLLAQRLWQRAFINGSTHRRPPREWRPGGESV